LLLQEALREVLMGAVDHLALWHHLWLLLEVLTLLEQPLVGVLAYLVAGGEKGGPSRELNLREPVSKLVEKRPHFQQKPMKQPWCMRLPERLGELWCGF
jgi:hypothetical protein